MKTRRISAGIYSILMCAAVLLLCTVTAVYAETGEATAPTITKQPTALEITYGYESASLSVTAEAAEEHTLSYQWYQSNSGKTYSQAISGATSAEYAFPTGKEVGYQGHYYCVVRATKGDKYAETETNAVKVEVKQKKVTITANNKQKEYGDPDPAFTANVVGLIGTDTVEYDVSCTHDEKIGDYEIKVTGVNEGELPNYDIVTEDGVLKIVKKTVTITAVNKQKVYGDPDPKLEYVLAGIEKSKESMLGKITLSRVEGDDVGSYAITPEADVTETENYKVTCVPGAFTITAKPVTVTADDKQMVYGGAAPEFTVTAEGLVGNDEIKDCTVICPKYGNNVSVGDYEIVVQVKTASNPNYTVTANSGTLTVTPKPITVTADNKEKVYGGADPELTVTAEGLVGTDKLEKYTVSRVEGDNVGEYAITVQFVAGANSNYAVTANPGTLTINPKLVTVTADNKEKIYGDANPELTATEEGLLGADSVSYELSREAGEDAGEYTITPSGDTEQGNYTVTFNTGKFKISRKAVTVTADDKEKVYGDDDPLLTATEEGLLGTDSVSYELSREEGDDVGEYAITPSGEAEQGNYAVTFETGKFKINKRPATVTAKNAQKQEGDPDPEFSATVTGVKEGDTLDYTLSRDAGDTEGRYAIKVVLGNNPNYDITAVDGELFIEAEHSSASSGRYSTKNTADSGTKTTDSEETKITPEPVQHTAFSDVSADSWYFADVEYVTSAGLMVGTDEDTFEPDEEVSRAMAVTILYLIDGTPDVDVETLFDDVDNDSWYAAAVTWAAENKIVSGYDENNFGQAMPITREQFATILYRYAEFKEYDTGNSADISGYDDAALVSGWALDAMRWANAEKFITGRTETTLDPQGSTTRAEAAAIFTRFSKWITAYLEN